MELNLIQKVVIWAPPILLAITLHEVAHGWVARLFGDDTAFVMGRTQPIPGTANRRKRRAPFHGKRRVNAARALAAQCAGGSAKPWFPPNRCRFLT